MGKIRVGTSGWSYDDWRGVFYPDGLRRRDELAYATDRFDSLEVNGSFYGLVSAATWRSWRDAAPRGFRYAVKGSRFITHNKKLGDVELPLANFFASGMLELGMKLGPILWQVSASMRFDPDRIEQFFTLLPKNTEEAAALAGKHDHRVSDPAFGPDESHRLRHVFEFRHESFITREMARIARRHGVAIAFSHSSEWPYVEELTAGFVYVRLHGPDRLYASRYEEQGLAEWSRKVKAWHRAAEPAGAARFTELEPPARKERDVYVYFDNDHRGYAPEEAATMRRMIGSS